MKKSLFYRWFGAGKFPKDLEESLRNEKPLFMEDGLGGSITWRNFRAPGKYFSFRRQWFAGSLALTETRLVGLRGKRFAINVPLNDERIRKMTLSVEKGQKLVIGFDAGVFHSNWSGRMEFRYELDDPQAFIDLLNQMRSEVSRNS